MSLVGSSSCRLAQRHQLQPDEGIDAPSGLRRLSDMTQRRFTALLHREGKWYVAHCAELGVVSQGETTDEALANLREAVELYIESFGDEDIPAADQQVMISPLDVAVGG